MVGDGGLDGRTMGEQRGQRGPGGWCREREMRAESEEERRRGPADSGNSSGRRAVG
jgi:hypothetical protein